MLNNTSLWLHQLNFPNGQTLSATSYGACVVPEARVSDATHCGVVHVAATQVHTLVVNNIIHMHICSYPKCLNMLGSYSNTLSGIQDVCISTHMALQSLRLRLHALTCLCSQQACM